MAAVNATKIAANPRGVAADARGRLSPDGKWKSFARVPNLLQYVPSNTYYGRLRVGGKLIRRSLRTTAFTTAKLRLADFEKQQRVAPPRASDAPASLRDARRAYEQELLCRHDLKPRTREYRLGCIKVLLKTWPGLDLKRLTQVSTADCQTWAARFAAEYDAHYFNQVLSTLRRILQLGGLHSNPALAVKRRGVKPRQLSLPEPGQFQALLAEMEGAGGRDSRNCADFVRFLAYSGCRLSEARQVRWMDIDWETGTVAVRNGKQRLTSSADPTRHVPIVEDLGRLLERLKQEPHAPEDAICKVRECQKSLDRACRILDVPRLTHHDLRHLFATRCIESGVDIPTVSRWLGHVDGGALAMRTYGHLRNEHSLAMAKKVKF